MKIIKSLGIILPICNGLEINYLPLSSIRKLYRTWYKNNKYTLEHVIPQSFVKNKEYNRDMHSILWFPNKVNNHRDTYKYVNDYTLHDTTQLLDYDGNIITNKKLLLCENSRIYLKSNFRREFTPIKTYQGKIARACMYFIDTYPEYKDMIFDRVIDADVIYTWNRESPVSRFELQKNQYIYEFQGNKNKYIDDPMLVLKDLQKL